MTLVTFLLTLGLVARVSHLVVDDLITKPLRDRLRNAAYDVKHYDTETSTWSPAARVKQWLSDLTDCIHCTSVWVGSAGAAVLYSDLADNRAYLIVATAATLSYLTGLIATLRYKLSD